MDSMQLDIAPANSRSSSNRIASNLQPQPAISVQVLPQRGKKARRPSRASGCLSELSIPIVLDEGYFDAVKAFSEIDSDFQSYLSQAEPHLIDCAVDVGVDNYDVHDFSEAGSSSADISDDEVEYCGYLGWLRH